MEYPTTIPQDIPLKSHTIPRVGGILNSYPIPYFGTAEKLISHII